MLTCILCTGTGKLHLARSAEEHVYQKPLFISGKVENIRIGLLCLHCEIQIIT